MAKKNKKELNSVQVNYGGRHAGYYEGTLQLRNPHDAIIDFIISQMQGKKGVFIAKEERVKNGIDLFISSQHFLQNLGRRLKKQFGGTLKISTRIFTRNKLSSKDVYRVTVFYEAPDIIKGNVLKINGRVVLVSHVDKFIRGIDLATGSKFSAGLKSSDYLILPKYKTKVSRLYPAPEVIHPLTFQSVIVANPSMKGLLLGQNINVILDDQVWII